MKSAWHIAKKDLRHLVVPLLLLTVLIAGQFVIGRLMYTAGNNQAEFFLQLSLYAKLLWAGELLLIYVLVSIVLHADALVGSTVFWSTRPISGPQLLAGKLLGLGIMFCAWPVVVHLPWWFWAHFSPAEIFGSAAEIAAINGIVVVIALFCAVLTPDLSRFLLWSVVLGIGGLAGISIYLGRAQLSPGDAVLGSRIVVAAALGLLGMLAVIIYQFLSRRLAVALAASTATMICIATILTSLPWKGYAIWTPSKISSSQLVKSAKVSIDWIQKSESDHGNVHLVVHAHGTGAPDEVWVAPYYSIHQLRWPTGEVLRQGGFEWGWAPPTGIHLEEDPEDMRRTEARKSYATRRFIRPSEMRITRPVPEGYSFSTSLYLSEGDFARMGSDAPIYSSTVWLSVEKKELSGEVSARVGGSMAQGSRADRITTVQVNNRSGDIAVELVERLRLSPWRDSLLVTARFGPERAADWYIVNAPRTWVGEGRPGATLTASIGGVGLRWESLNFRGRQQWDLNTKKWELAPVLQSGFSLARIDRHEIGRFSASMETDHFSVAEPHSSVVTSLNPGAVVRGEVEKPGTVWEKNNLLRSALSGAGGLTEVADTGAIRIIRRIPGQEMAEILNVNMDEYLSGKLGYKDSFPLLQPGDIIEVPRKP